MKLKPYTLTALSSLVLSSSAMAYTPLPEHLNSSNPTNAERRFPSVQETAKRAHDKLDHHADLRTQQLDNSADADCNEFIGLSGWNLVTKLAESKPQCVSPLYNLKDSRATSLFSESNMRYVAAGFRDRALNYTGTDTTGVESLIYFLRAALYVQYYNPELVPAYSSAVNQDITTALNNFFNNSNTWRVLDTNGPVLKEALVLVDSSGLGAEFNHITLKVLAEYNSQWKTSRAMTAAANAIFTTLFRAQWDDKMKALFKQDHRILNALYQFQQNNRNLIGTDKEYILVNAVREMSRLYYIDEMRTQVASLVKQVINSSDRDGNSRVVWMTAAEMADYYDRSHCNDYGICGFKAQLEKETLAFNWKCSDSLWIRAQGMYRDQANWACGVLGKQETYFHSKLTTNMIPVEKDNNEALELIVFDSPADYRSYAGTFFGISTDNGGMYLEGSPSGLKNQARFIAHEADWLRPDFHVWNLQHEYVHYLDGRYNLFGDFQRSTSTNIIWWVEGLAEYISYQDANSSAITMGETQAYNLSEIFKNTYDSGTDRIYRWGYLAVRFMFEKHYDDVERILNLVRNNQYIEYHALIDNIGTRYDNEWRTWLVSGLSQSDDGISANGASDADANSSGSEGNWEGPVSQISTDYTPCVITNEDYRYTPDKQLEIDKPMECIDAQSKRASFSFANLDGKADAIWIKTSGGWGDADIYYGTTGWADGESNDGFAIEWGNDELIKVNLNPDEYWHYITLSGDFGGVDMQVSTTELFPDDPEQNPDPDPNPQPTPHCGDATLSYGKLEFSQSECVAGGRTSMYFWVDEDNTQVTMTTKGGDGNANLYYNANTWAKSNAADKRSENSANNETIRVTANRGWRYVTVDSPTEYSGVTIQVTME